jgi:hypothetical protein
MLSRPVQLIPTSISSSEHHHHHHHHHHHPHITHVQTVKNEKTDSYPISMHFGLSSPTTTENPLNVQLPHQHSYSTKTFDSPGHQAYIHMQLLPSTSNSESINSSQQPVQFTLPTTHLYSSSSSSVLISTTQRSMDHNNNHQSTTTTITTPIIREMQTDEKINDSTIIKNRKTIEIKCFYIRKISCFS